MMKYDYHSNKVGSVSVRLCIVLCLILAAIVVLLSIVASPENIPFWPYTTRDVVVLLVSIFLISTFIERSVEVIKIVWREREKQELNSTVEMLRKRSNQSAKKITKEMLAEEEEAISRLEKYKSETKTLVTHIAFILGIIVSAVGIRILQPLLDPHSFRHLTSLQISLFRGVDTLITGALLGGGSKGIHEILEAFLNTVEKYRENLGKK